MTGDWTSSIASFSVQILILRKAGVEGSDVHVVVLNDIKLSKDN